MPEQTVLEFYTVHPDQELVEAELKKELYDPKKAAEILSEAAKYHIELESVYKAWYDDEEDHSHEKKTIDPDQILVKNGAFYGCLLVRKSSDWGYRHMDEHEHLTSVTLDKPEANVESIDHSTQNGDSYGSTDAFLVKTEQ